jgi:RNA polymerase sigma-70 factor (ECF subfamily)
MIREARQFVTTHWTAVLAASGNDTASAREGMAELCQTYWYPLYFFIRRQGNSSHDAEDLTQAFFALLLEKNFLERVTRDGGKFRSYLLVALKRFLANQYDYHQAKKRGGGQVLVSLDQQAAEARYLLEPVDERTPETIFNQRWAQTLLDCVMAGLEEEYKSSGKTGVFRALRPTLKQARGSVPYREIAEQLEMTEAAIKMAALRLRTRYRELLRQEIGKTVTTPDEIEEEIRQLFASFGG